MRKMRRSFTSRELSLLAILSALGGVVSISVGYAGSFLASIPFLPFGAAQIFSGLHVFWLALAARMINRGGVGTLTGILKGLVESALISFHGFLALPISAVEGAVLDICFLVFKRDGKISNGVAAGFSSASNVLVLQALVLPELPPTALIFMYSASFLSGFIFAGLLSRKVMDYVRRHMLKRLTWSS